MKPRNGDPVEACNAEWNARYQRMLETEDKLAASELELLALMKEVIRLRGMLDKMHGLVEQLAGRFNGYLPWSDRLRDSTVLSHEMFIADTIKKADAFMAFVKKAGS